MIDDTHLDALAGPQAAVRAAVALYRRQHPNVNNLPHHLGVAHDLAQAVDVFVRRVLTEQNRTRAQVSALAAWVNDADITDALEVLHILAQGDTQTAAATADVALIAPSKEN